MKSLINHNESELVTLLKNKDRKAFDYLYDNYAAALYGVLKKMLEDEEQAKDLLQDVFIKIWKNIEQLDLSKGRLFTWMLNIARHTAIDLMRSAGFQKQKQNSGLDKAVYITPTTPINIDSIGIKKIVENMQEDYRKVLELAYFKGMTQDEISKELGIPVGTVKTRCRNALISLKKIFQS